MAALRMLEICWARALLCAALALGVLPGGVADGAGRRAVVIALDGPIGPAIAAYVVRSLTTAAHQDAAVAVLRMDTPGGLDSAMREIVRAVLASPVPVIGYVAPSGARAASAGTFILYAASLAAMAPGTNLGAATPVSLFGEAPMPPPETPPPGDAAKETRPAGESDRSALLNKVTNDAAAYIRSLATLHGRNADWAERAVREAVSLPDGAALEQHVVDLVATDVPDLLAAANGRDVIVQGRHVHLNTVGLEIEQIEPGWSDRLLALLTDPSIVYLLLLAGIFGAVVEFTHPGVFAPGVLGTICLLVGGYGLNLLPVDYAGLALIVFGLGLMLAEAFVPAFGAFVLGGATAFAIGSLMTFDTPGLRLPLSLIAGATLVFVALFGVALALLLRARRHPPASGNAVLIGMLGQTVRWSADAGEVTVQGERWRARASRPLRAGQIVRVVGRDGLTLLVEVT